MPYPAFLSVTELGKIKLRALTMTTPWIMASRGVIVRIVEIIIHIQVASRLQLNDTVGQFKVLPRTIDCQLSKCS